MRGYKADGTACDCPCHSSGGKMRHIRACCSWLVSGAKPLELNKIHILSAVRPYAVVEDLEGGVRLEMSVFAKYDLMKLPQLDITQSPDITVKELLGFPITYLSHKIEAPLIKVYQGDTLLETFQLIDPQ